KGGILKLWPLTIGLAAWAGPLQAQSVTASAVRGTVTDSAGQALSGALVWLTDMGTGVERSTETSGGGEFVFSLIPSGEYEILAEQVGFRPRRMLGVGVAPGSRVEVQVFLARQDPPVTSIDTARFAGGGTAHEPDAAQGFGRFALRRLMGASGGVNQAAGLGTVMDDALRVEGLPEEMSAVALDGLVFTPARHPDLPGSATFDAGLPVMGLAGVSLLADPSDLEWSDAAGGVLHLRSLGGARATALEAYGDFSPGSLTRSDFLDPDGLPSSWRAGAVMRGAAVRDTAHFAVGGLFERHWSPRARVANDSALLAVTAAQGINLSSYVDRRFVREERAAGFGSLEWQLSDQHRLRLWASFGQARQSEPQLWRTETVTPDAEAKQTDALAALTLSSRFSSVVAQELRLGFYRSERDYAATGLPGTLVGTGPGFGVDAALPGRFQRTDLIIREVVHADAGRHQLKLGFSGSVAAHDRAFIHGRNPTFFFTDANALGLGRGAYVGTTSSAPGTQFSTPQLGLLFQDRWMISSGFDLITGLRYDVEWLPLGDIAPNSDWAQRTGIRNDSIPRTAGRLSSRVGFRWSAGGWLLRGALGVYGGRVDPAVSDELITESGRVAVRRGMGALGVWPNEPNAVAAPEVGDRLTLLGRDYEAPRSAKAGLGLRRAVGSGHVSASVAYRHTDFLLRRHDLNRLPGTAGDDQYGRQLYGSMMKEGALLGAAPGTNRRFSGFELVSALDPDGYSDYWGVTVGLEQPAGRFLRLSAAYTYSQTTDNWLGARYGGPYAELSPFPDSLGGVDWADGRSDLDVPHRLVVGVELSPLGPRGFSVAALYRYRSGLPFTPGFAPGVDANGDGAFNDPAYVDNALAGMAEAIAAWPCLASQVGRFAQRNACREPDRRSLDLRFGVGPFQLGNQPVEVWAEATNLIEPEDAVWDRALYLVDPNTALVTDPATGRVTVPLTVNPGFGRVLAYRSAGRVVRLGLRVGFQ
ncbi:MAG TPA: carboxypeptidase regulatory-like domain-containing protein, partial [Gemmatimonadales bacterium]|nr:carboxypeptidase regulatory-like domain-containing protein [Gemmatimonadales bacterium]